VEQELTSPVETPEAHEESASDILRSLAAHPETKISFGEVVAAAGSRVHGLALFLFVLPETLPLPLPSASGILGIPLLLISGHLAIFGEAKALPPRIRAIKIPRTVFVVIARYIAPVLGWIEQVSRPRWAMFVREERPMGILCLYLSLILFLPLPLMNAPPAICLAIVALGIIHRDGVLIAAGAVGAALVTATLVLVADWLTKIAGWMLNWMWPVKPPPA
jgi:hypothetical protein